MNKMSVTRDADKKVITAKGHFSTFAKFPQGTVLGHLGKILIFDDLSKLIETKMTKFFKSEDDAPITFESNEDGDFKITIYDPENITNLKYMSKRSMVIDEPEYN